MAKEDYILKQTGEQVQKAIDDALALAPATVETPGLMSAADKEKLNGLPTGASLESSLGGKVDKVTGKGLSTNDYDNSEKSKVASASQDVTDIKAKIPSQASDQNQLADKNFVNSSIATATADFKGTYDSLSKLQAVTADKNDYGYVVSTDQSGNTVYSRYKYNGSAWVFEYDLNNSSFTAAEWASIQSQITAALVQKLSALPTNQQLTQSLNGKQDNIQDLSTIRSGAAAGATAYQKPGTGIPSTDMASGVQTSLGKADTAYQKPSGGVPKLDLASPVQTSLGKADTAIQPAEFNELEEEVGTIGNGAYEEAWDGSSAPVVADIPAGVSVTYNSTSYTGTLAASASTVDKIYLVSDGNGNYDRYTTVEANGAYSWKKVGSTAIPLSNYATKNEVSQLQHKVDGGTVSSDITSSFSFSSNGGFYIDQTIGATFTGELLYTSGGDYAPAVDVSLYDKITLVDGGSSGNRAVILCNSANKVVFSAKWGDHSSDHTIVVNVSQLGGKYLYVSKGTGISCVITAENTSEGFNTRITTLENDVVALNEEVNGSTETLAISESSDYMYNENAGLVSAAGSYYADVDLSAYEGKTLRITMAGIGATSGRYTGIAVNGAFVTKFAEKNYSSVLNWPIPGNAHLLESHSAASTIQVQVITASIQEEIADIADEAVYVDKTGNDGNSGKYGSPFLTIQKAINSNASRILISGGKYLETLDLGSFNKRKIELLKNDQFKDVIIENAPTTISTSDGTLVSGSTAVYKLTGVSGITSEMRFLIQVGVPYGDIPTTERRPEQRGKAKRMDDTVIRKVKNTVSTVSAAVTEIDRALSEDGRYMYYLDGTDLYFSRPSAISEDTPLVRPSGKASLFNNIPDAMTIIMTGIHTRFIKVNIERTRNSVITDCCSELSFGGAAFSYDGSINAVFRRCEASSCCEGWNGDGFNAHADSLPGYSSGEPLSKCCTCTLENCWSHDNMDDGYSDHQRCETNVIGGLYEYNGKGGITPSYGSHCTCYDVESRHNCNGFFCSGKPDSTEGGVGTQLTCYNCVAEENTNPYGQNYNNGNAEQNAGFYSVNDSCLIIAYNCLSVRNKVGYNAASEGQDNGRLVLYDCKAVGNTQVDWQPKSLPDLTTIINGNGLSY